MTQIKYNKRKEEMYQSPQKTNKSKSPINDVGKDVQNSMKNKYERNPRT